MSHDQLHFGIFCLTNVPDWTTEREAVHKNLEQIRLADELGFEEAWVAEHNARQYGIISSSQVLLAACAGTTKNIRLGSGVTRLPMNHPLKLAEDFSLLDVISDGRLNFGIGKAYDLLEFQAYDIDPDERDERYQETFDIIMEGWRNGRISYQGKHFRVPGRGEQATEIQLMPMPLQKPHPPVFVMVSQTEASLRNAAREGFAFVLGQMPTWEDMARLVNIYREEARDAGRSYDEIDELVARSSQLKAIHVSDDRATAAREYEQGLMWYLSILSNRAKVGLGLNELSFQDYLDKGAIILGSSDDVAQQLEDYKKATGIGGLVGWFDAGSQPQEQVLRSMTKFAQEVRPQLTGAAS
ncbi:LLM class flavin-dependent oxidoreductase [Brevibacterium album]|uniref:LLM class flavin-dependent oxidoreductase n=1 Tax=Brevibacterium album TaxID=417948 RepID=UPI00041A8C90|nr:LLM class flavin-dependent oxidoreductase [Brevibacterium album]